MTSACDDDDEPLPTRKRKVNVAPLPGKPAQARCSLHSSCVEPIHLSKPQHKAPRLLCVAHGSEDNSKHPTSGSALSSLTLQPRQVESLKVHSTSTVCTPRHHVQPGGHSSECVSLDELHFSPVAQHDRGVNCENRSQESNTPTATTVQGSIAANVAHVVCKKTTTSNCLGLTSCSWNTAKHGFSTCRSEARPAALSAVQSCAADPGSQSNTCSHVIHAAKDLPCAPEASDAVQYEGTAVQAQQNCCSLPVANSCEVACREQRASQSAEASSALIHMCKDVGGTVTRSRLPLHEAMKCHGSVFDSSSTAESDLAAALRAAGAIDAATRLQHEHMTAALVMMAHDADLRQLLSRKAASEPDSHLQPPAQHHFPQNRVDTTVQLVRRVASRLCRSLSHPEEHETKDAVKSECLLMRALKARERYNSRLGGKQGAIKKSCVAKTDLQRSLEHDSGAQGASDSTHSPQLLPASSVLHEPAACALGPAAKSAEHALRAQSCAMGAERSTVDSHAAQPLPATAQHAVQGTASESIATGPLMLEPCGRTSPGRGGKTPDPSLLRYLTGPAACKLRTMAARGVVQYCRDEELQSWRLCQGHLVDNRNGQKLRVSVGQDHTPKAQQLQGLYIKAAAQAHNDPHLGVRLCTAILQGATKYGVCVRAVQQDYNIEKLDPAAVYDIDASGRLVVVSR